MKTNFLNNCSIYCHDFLSSSMSRFWQHRFLIWTAHPSRDIRFNIRLDVVTESWIKSEFILTHGSRYYPPRSLQPSTRRSNEESLVISLTITIIYFEPSSVGCASVVEVNWKFYMRGQSRSQVSSPIWRLQEPCHKIYGISTTA